MRNNKFTRFVSLILACLCLVSSAVITVSASGSGSSVTDKKTSDYTEQLDTISYADYMSQNELYFGNRKNVLDEEIVLDLFDDSAVTWYYLSTDGSRYEKTAEGWKMTKLDAKGNPTEIYNSADGVLYELSTDPSVTFSLTEEEAKELVSIGRFGGASFDSVYTPSQGTLCLSVNLNALGITEAVLCGIRLSYFPVEGKFASVEREFYVNGKAPFSEARSLTMPKLYTSVANDGNPLRATYKPGRKESVDTIRSEADAAGVTYTLAEDGKTFTFYQPETVTAAGNEFIDKYDLRFIVTDADGNELRPTQKQSPEWTAYTLHDSDGYYAEAFGFVLTPDEDGKVLLSFKGVNEPAAFSDIVLTPYVSSITYAEYLEAIRNEVGLADGEGALRLEAEYTSRTSTNVVYPVEDRTSPLTSPSSTSRTLLNTIGTEKWETAGQWVEYRFSVEKSGMYDIYARFRQSYLDGMYANRVMQIFTDYDSKEAYVSAVGHEAGYYNGLPFEEASRFRFDYGDNWQVTKMTDGATNEKGKELDYPVYFEGGVVYTLRYEVTLGSMSEQVRNIETILNALNNDYLNIIKLTGTSPDDYRDYSFSRLLPDTLIDMMRQAYALEDLSDFLRDTAGVASTYTGICDKLVTLVKKMVHDPDSIAKNLDNFKSYVGSLGTFLSDAKTQPLQVDYFSVQAADVKAPKGKANFFQTFWHECKSFIQSFVRDYNSMGAMDEGQTEETVSVWLAYGRDQSQVIRNLSTNDFTANPEYNISVDLKLITGSTLLPSILAGMGPDVFLGLDQATVINYAIRGALRNIEDMEGFDELLESGIFNDAAMTVLSIKDAEDQMHYYGLPEAQGFPMMFVRLDILANLGIEIPKTWDEIYKVQTKLQTNNMLIGVTTEFKIFLYQWGGELFADDGMRINLDSKLGLASFEKMCNMFTQYSFPYKYEAANRFRTGEMPIIISDYVSLYNKLKVFATELDGCWTFVPLPGFEQEDGTINNCSISAVTAAIIIAGCDHEEAAWKYIKWYTGADCQTKYANEMVAIMGDSAKHSTANSVALASMPWTHDEYVEIEKQFNSLASIPNYPGYYYIGRYTEFAFLAAYNNDADPSTELLSYIKTINTEITRKREEFGLETLEIGETLASKRIVQAQKAIEQLEGIDQSGKYTEMIESAKYAMANENITQLNLSADLFSATLSLDYRALLNKANSDPENVTKAVAAANEQIQQQSYFKRVGKQTAEAKNGGYTIASLNEEQLVYFISACLADAAGALATY